MQMTDLPYDLPDAARPFRPVRRRLRRRDADPRARRAPRPVRALPRTIPRSSPSSRTSSRTTSAGRRPSTTRSAWSAEAGGAQIWLKREDLNHTGAHKINNCIGQALLAKRLGKPRVIAETGAGQHGVAAATVAARFGMECVVYMGSEDIERQAQNVFRMKLLGATVVPVESGSKTLKDALNEAMRDWVTNVANDVLHHRHLRGPAPVPDDGPRFPERDRPRVPDADAGGGGPRSRRGHRVRGRRIERDRHLPSVHSARRRAADRRRSGGRRHRHRQARGVAHRRAAGRAARQPHVSAAGCGRPDHPDAFDLGRARLSGRGARARVAQGHGPRGVRDDHRRRGARRVPRLLPHRRHHSGARIGARARLRRAARGDAAEGQDPARQPLRPRRQGHAHRRRALGTPASSLCREGDARA